MSLNSWKKEFYQGRIREAAKDPLAAVEHSLQKWKGLKAKHLAKHGLEHCHGDIRNIDTGKEFSIDDTSCALCQYTKPAPGYGSICTDCPVVAAIGRKCDGDSSPYSEWLKNKDPQPMIELLKATRKHLQNKAK